MFKIQFDLPNSKKKLINPEDLLPKTVENTRGELIPFDAYKIIESIIQETNLDRPKAIEVTRNVLRKLSSLGLEFIAAPHMRELVCGELTAMGLHEYRNHYTRLGIPIYDVKSMLEEGMNQSQNSGINTTLSYVSIASQVIEQYVHLDQLSAKAREFHLTGRINIDLLEFWDQPNSQLWDLRTILMYGLPPIPLAGVAKSKPAQNALTAVSHAAKWLGLAQKEFSGSQGYDNFTTFLAPYLGGLDYKNEDPNQLDIVQVAQSFVFETNQICGSFWGQNVKVFIACTPYVPEELQNIDAVGHGGKIVGKYKDFEKETQMFFRALVEVYGEGDAEGAPIILPKHIVKVTPKKWDMYQDDYQFLLKTETIPKGSTYFVNAASGLGTKELFSEFVRIPLVTSDETAQIQPKSEEQFRFECSLNNFGVIQAITINLPHAAYLAKKEGTDIIKQLDEILPEIRFVLMKKYEMIVKEIKAVPSKLPFCRECLEEKHLGIQCLYNIANQYLVVSFTGLEECVQVLTNFGLANPEGAKIGYAIIDHLQEFARKMSDETKLAVIVSETNALNSAHRFAKVDMKYLSDYAHLFVKGLSNEDFTYNSGAEFLNVSSKTELDALLPTLSTLQKKIYHGAMVKLPKEVVLKSFEEGWAFCSKIIKDMPLLGFYFE